MYIRNIFCLFCMCAYSYVDYMCLWWLLPLHTEAGSLPPESWYYRQMLGAGDPNRSPHARSTRALPPVLLPIYTKVFCKQIYFLDSFICVCMVESGSEHSGTLSCRLPTTSGPAKLPSSLLPCISSQVDLGCLGTILLSWVFPTAHPLVTESCGDCSGSVPSLYHDLLRSSTISVKKWPLWRCFPIN